MQQRLPWNSPSHMFRKRNCFRRALSQTRGYKFSEAALEDYRHLAPQIRDRFLAASVFYLRGADGPDNELVQRTREALHTPG